MVERWLQQLEQQMIVSLRDVASEAITAYPVTKREDWVLIWPGQIVQAGSCVQYTAEVKLERAVVSLYITSAMKQRLSLRHFSMRNGSSFGQGRL